MIWKAFLWVCSTVFVFPWYNSSIIYRLHNSVPPQQPLFPATIVIAHLYHGILLVLFENICSVSIHCSYTFVFGHMFLWPDCIDSHRWLAHSLLDLHCLMSKASQVLLIMQIKIVHVTACLANLGRWTLILKFKDAISCQCNWEESGRCCWTSISLNDSTVKLVAVACGLKWINLLIRAFRCIHSPVCVAGSSWVIAGELFSKFRLGGWWHQKLQRQGLIPWLRHVLDRTEFYSVPCLTPLNLPQKAHLNFHEIAVICLSLYRI